jgi:UDP-glucuronate decarboxylase
MTKLMDNDEVMGPINIGNPTEFTMLELAKVQLALSSQFSNPNHVRQHGFTCGMLLFAHLQVVQEVVNPNAKIEFRENTADDPSRRKPDITKVHGLQPLLWACRYPPAYA